MPPDRPAVCWRNYLPVGLLLLIWLLFGAGGEVLGWSSSIVAHPGLVLLAPLATAPGWALLRLLWPSDWRPVPVVAWGLAVGLSVALPPLLLLLSKPLQLPWNGPATWAYLLASIALVLWPTGPAGEGFRLRGVPWLWRQLSRSRPDLLLPLVLLLVLLVRLFAVRDLPTGMLGDAYHHTLIAQLLVEQEGLFSSWQPYAPLVTLTYHFGFHANAAFAHWISGAPLPQTVLWTGQIVNTLVVALVAALTSALGGGRVGTLWAAVLTGFVLLLPGQFVNWGRYTQLTGQAVLLTLLLCWQALTLQTTSQVPAERQMVPWLGSALQATRHNGRLLLLVALVGTAMLLTHYRMAIFAALFVLALLAGQVLARRSVGLLALLLLQAALAGGLTLLLAAPWLLNLLDGYLMRNTLAFVQGTVGPERIAAVSTLPSIHPLFAPHYLIGAMLGGLLLAAWQRRWRMLLPALWAVLLVLCVVPGVVGLPGTGVVDYLTAFSTLYLAIVPPAAYLLAALYLALLRRLRLPAFAGALLLALGLGGVVSWGTPGQAHIVNGQTQLVTPADMVAMEWIRAETPEDARFLVNSFPAYGGTLIAGTDAGWWLPLLARRATNLPPITYGSERSADPAYPRQVNRLATFLRGRPLTNPAPVAIDLTTPAALVRLRAAGITHIYSGAHAHPPPSHADRIDTALLRASPAFTRVYAADGVEIFRLHTSARGSE